VAELCLLGPYTEKGTQAWQVYEEVMLTLFSYFMIGHTDFVDDLYTRNTVGLAMIAFVMVYLISSLGSLTIMSLHRAYAKSKLKYARA
jgi:hypothetical protein